MRGALLGIALLSLCGCKKHAADDASSAGKQGELPAGPPAPDLRGLNWEAFNFDSSLRIEQTAKGEDECEVRCVDNATQAVRWSGGGCRGTALDLRFVSPDCSRLMVVHTLPSASAFRYAKLASVWTEKGLDWELQGGGLAVDQTKMPAAGTSFRWLKGVLDAPGERPHLSADGAAVELETLDGKKQTIPFVPGKHP
jgi:hypothetical protein